MAISKVVYDGNTLIDLTSDTVGTNTDNVSAGLTFHGNNGNALVGTGASASSVGGLGNAIGMRGWNQLIPKTSNGWMPLNANLSIDNYKITATINNAGPYFSVYRFTDITVTEGHTYIAKARIKAPRSGMKGNFRLYTSDASTAVFVGVQSEEFVPNVETDVFTIATATGSATNAMFYAYPCIAGSTPASVGDVFTLEDFMFIDLTSLFGSGNEPTTVAQFRQMFGADYYPYCSGSFGDLLWTNASPSSSFAAQTVSVDLSNYSSIIVVSKETTSADIYCSNLFNKDGLTYKANMYDSYYYTRTYSVNSSSIVIGTGYIGTTPGTNYLIPYRIYGIK